MGKIWIPNDKSNNNLFPLNSNLVITVQTKFLRIDPQSDFRAVGRKQKNANERTNIIHEFEGCFLRGHVA